jgi:hypothetical protein
MSGDLQIAQDFEKFLSQINWILILFADFLGWDTIYYTASLAATVKGMS